MYPAAHPQATARLAGCIASQVLLEVQCALRLAANPHATKEAGEAACDMLQ